MHQPGPPIVHSFPSVDDVVEALAEYVISVQNQSIDKRGRFTIALSGGSQPKMLRGLIGRSNVHWDKWHVFYVDERVVPLDHEDSNHRSCQEALYSHVPIPKKNIHPIDYSLKDDLEGLSDAYEQKLIHEFASKNTARFPIFDLILLGMGPDGHTASLFPGHPLLSEESLWVAYLDDSPKPPPQRITLTLPVINHAANVAFIATGEGKQDVLKTILDEPEVGLPCSLVRLHHGSLIWFVDDAAAAKLQYPRTPFE